MEEFHIANTQYTTELNDLNWMREKLNTVSEFYYPHIEEAYYLAYDVLQIASANRAVAMQAWLYPSTKGTA